MYHPNRLPKGRVIAKDTVNFGLHYSLQAQGTAVERTSTKQPIGRDYSILSRPISNPNVPQSTKYRHVVSPSSESDSTVLFHNSLSSFRDLSKVQKQVLQPKNAHLADSVTGKSTSRSSADETETHPEGQRVHSADSHNKLNKNQVFMPGDRVVFAESPSAPGIPIVYRHPEERQANPDRLNLDRRRLTVCPILEGEDSLRLLNFQHNLVTKIQHLSHLRRLIFLDFYDNQIEDITGLASLRSLRVLMLGKNRIKAIQNLEALTKLDVLDLHGNKISKIENLNHLSELRVLNLAGNEMQCVCNISGMKSLAELNLRRNQITSVTEIDQLPNLQRLFLSFNNITCWEDISCLGNSVSLTEVSLDGNPFADGNMHAYKTSMLRHIPNLRQLDVKRVSDEEKRIAGVQARKEEEKKKEIDKVSMLKEKRRLAITNAQRQWERSHTAHKSSDEPNVDSHSKSSISSSGVSSTASTEDKERIDHAVSRMRSDRSSPLVQETKSSLSICHLAELDGETLYLYGPGALDALDRQWGTQASTAVNIIAFKFITMDEIVPHLHKLRNRFPSAHTVIFTQTSIHSLQQFNALSVLRKLDNLTISPEGNPVVQFKLWKPYALFRLANLSLQKLNDVEVTPTDMVNSEKLFGTLAHITTSQLPQSRLLTLMGNSRRKRAYGDVDRPKKEGKHDRTSSSDSVGRAGLQYWTAQAMLALNEEQTNRTNFTKNYFRDITQNAVSIELKKKKLERVFPQVVCDIIQQAVIDMLDKEKYVKQSLEKLQR